MMCSQTDFFVGIEGHTNFAVFNLWMFQQVNHGLNYFRNASLVVCSQQGVSVGDDEVFSNVVQKFWEFLWRRDNVVSSIENDISAIVFFNNPWFDFIAGAIRTGVHV